MGGRRPDRGGSCGPGSGAADGSSRARCDVTTASTVTVTTPEVQTTELPPDGIWPDGQNWIDSGVVLAAGDQVLIEAEGEATHDGPTPTAPTEIPGPRRRGRISRNWRKRTTTHWWDVSVRTTRRSWSANSSHSPPTTREPCISVSTTWAWRTTRASTSSTSPLPDRDQPPAMVVASSRMAASTSGPPPPLCTATE